MKRVFWYYLALFFTVFLIVDIWQRQPPDAVLIVRIVMLGFASGIAMAGFHCQCAIKLRTHTMLFFVVGFFTSLFGAMLTTLKVSLTDALAYYWIALALAFVVVCTLEVRAYKRGQQE